jgi:hypothetical protein
MVGLVDILTVTAVWVAAVSLAVIALLLYRRYAGDKVPGLWQARLEAYSEILHNVIRVNRLAVELEEQDKLIVQWEKYVLDDESKFDEPMDELNQVHQENYFIISPEVRDEVEDYITYLSTHHDLEPHIGELLQQGGRITAAMREDLNLSGMYQTEQEGSENSES